MADEIMQIPPGFKDTFDVSKQEGLRILGASSAELLEYFRPYIPKDFVIPSYFNFTQKSIDKNKLLFAPYPASDMYAKINRVLVFPRYRGVKEYAKRNLPKEFYERAISAVLDRIRDVQIVSMGVPSGSYNLDIDSNRFEDFVGKTDSIQDVIDFCYTAKAAFGGTSSLPQISMLQGVPTFVIGHERERFLVDRNWLNTKAGFYKIDKDEYNNFCNDTAIEKLVNFIGEVING
jgi:hypothetical protein